MSNNKIFQTTLSILVFITVIFISCVFVMNYGQTEIRKFVMNYGQAKVHVNTARPFSENITEYSHILLMGKEERSFEKLWLRNSKDIGCHYKFILTG